MDEWTADSSGRVRGWPSIDIKTKKVLNMALYHFRSERNIQHLTMEEKFIASNVPKPTLLRHIRQLEMFLKIKVYRIRIRNRAKIWLGLGLRLGLGYRVQIKVSPYASEIGQKTKCILRNSYT